MSDAFHDPVGDRLRAHDVRMREARWLNAKEILIALCICAAIVGVAWAVAWGMVHNKPRFSTGFTPAGMPWCESMDERQCPIYGQGGVVLSR